MYSSWESTICTHIWDIPLYVSDTSRCYCELCTVYSPKYRPLIPVCTRRLHFETKLCNHNYRMHFEDYINIFDSSNDIRHMVRIE